MNRCQYFLVYLFMVALGLCCFTGEWGLLCSCHMQASHLGVFSCCRAQAQCPWASVIVALGPIDVSLGCEGFSSCGLWLVAPLCLSFPTYGIIPWSRREDG